MKLILMLLKERKKLNIVKMQGLLKEREKHFIKKMQKQLVKSVTSIAAFHTRETGY